MINMKKEKLKILFNYIHWIFLLGMFISTGFMFYFNNSMFEKTDLMQSVEYDSFEYLEYHWKWIDNYRNYGIAMGTWIGFIIAYGITFGSHLILREYK